MTVTIRSGSIAGSWVSPKNLLLLAALASCFSSAHAASAATGLGGRGDGCTPCLDEETGEDSEDCLPGGDGKCLCYNRGDTCIDEMGSIYTIWLVLLFVGFTWHLFYASIFFVDIIRHHDKSKPLSAMDKICLMSSVAVFLRYAWCICAINGRSPGAFWGGPVLDSLLLKIPQIIWLGNYFFLTIVWGQLSDQILKMKKTNEKDNKRSEYIANCINIFLVVIIIPAHILASTGVATFFFLVVNAISAILVIILCFGAFFSGRRLIAGLSNNASAAPIVRTIKLSVILGCVGGIFLILSVIYNSIFLGGAKQAPYQSFIFWTLVHVLGEAVGIQPLFETKRQQRLKKIKDASTTKTSTSSSVAPEGA